MPKITKADAIPLMIAAYKERKLSAQNTEKATTRAPQYRSEAGPCIVGVVLSDEDAAILDRGSMEGESLYLRAFFSGHEALTSKDARQLVPQLFDKEEAGWFCDAQYYHDRWFDAERVGNSSLARSYEHALCVSLGIEVNT